MSSCELLQLSAQWQLGHGFYRYGFSGGEAPLYFRAEDASGPSLNYSEPAVQQPESDAIDEASGPAGRDSSLVPRNRDGSQSGRKLRHECRLANRRQP
jgi:hypothetical protein